MNYGFIRKKLRNLSWPAPRRDQTLLLGRRGERAAARYLKHQHFHVLVRNFHCVAGEVDLICSLGDTLFFVEVKTRTSDDAEDIQDALREAQRRRIENAARYFLMRRSSRDRPCRFDVVTVVWPARGSPRIEHFPDAFQPRRSY